LVVAGTPLVTEKREGCKRQSISQRYNPLNVARRPREASGPVKWEEVELPEIGVARAVDSPVHRPSRPEADAPVPEALREFSVSETDPIAAAAGEAQAAAPTALLRMAFDEVGAFLSRLPTMVSLTDDDRAFGSSIVRDLLLVEAHRATTIAAAAAQLIDPGPHAAQSGTVDCRAALARVAEGIVPAARLKGIELNWPTPGAAVVRGDFAALVTAWAAILYAYLMVARPNDTLRVSFDVPRVRPAVLFQVVLSRAAPAEGIKLAGDLLPADDRLDVSAAGVLISAAQLTARHHGGRFAQEDRPEGLTGLFVIPVPFDGLQKGV
jgi:hypothetical protein